MALLKRRFSHSFYGLFFLEILVESVKLMLNKVLKVWR